MKSIHAMKYPRKSTKTRRKREIHFDFDSVSAQMSNDFYIAKYSPDEIKQKIIPAVKQIVTPKQYDYIMLYFVENWSMTEIADYYGVVVSSVYRTIERGLNRCKNFIIL